MTSNIRRLIPALALTASLLATAAPAGAFPSFGAERSLEASGRWVFPADKKGRRPFVIVEAWKRARPAGAEHNQVTYVTGFCRKVRGEMACPPSRIMMFSVPKSAFVVDPELDGARLTFRSGRSVLKVVWTATGDSSPAATPAECQAGGMGGAGVGAGKLRPAKASGKAFGRTLTTRVDDPARTLLGDRARATTCPAS